ncbi:hypothetical protein [Streptacidiphilus anmyonensis]|uniref:hypothetical protein n=1 Tax=Streptacidiphilus anmyonensis TaxID=405782 RepID=UPI0005A87204|nr:hypothetical protein [Streptacidiphilus anmyonensis]
MADSVARADSPFGRAGALASGFDGVPWPQFWRSLPALVVPQVPGLERPLESAAGWSAVASPFSGGPHLGWSLVQHGRGISITAPDGALWYEGCPLLTRDWRRAAAAQGAVLLISGPFARIDQFAPAASAGRLLVLLVTAR